ncbi:MAG: site-specific DNA-methyltransferase [Bacteroidota bacterium]
MKQFIDLPDLSLARFEQQFDLSGIEKEEAETEAISLNEETTIAVKVGDLFKLGEHRLLCGDCLKEENITLLMDGQLAQILCTDPPYNLKTADFQGKGSVKHEDFVMAAGEMSDEEFATFLKQVMQLACKHTIDGGLHYIFMDHRHSWHMGEAARKVYGSPEPKQTCVWKKDIPANGSFYRVQHEFCFIYKYGTAKHKSYLELKDRSRANVWEYAGANSWGNPDRDREGHLSGLGELANHPTPKNSAMIADIFLDVTDEGDIVLEMFSGSGTAIVAGERTKRKVYAIDLKPDFVQSTLIRYYKHCLKHDTPFDFEHVNGEITESLIKEWYEATLTPKEATTNQANAEESNTD